MPAQSETNGDAGLPSHIRISTGTAIVLGLLEGRLDAAPSTAYLMTYHKGKCTANCSFCPQARTSKSPAKLLSRVTWPKYLSLTVLRQLGEKVSEGRIERVCFQALNYPEVFTELCAFVNFLKGRVKVPLSVSCQPTASQDVRLLAEAGVDRIGIALDAANEQLFDSVKGVSCGGPYRWLGVRSLLRVAVEVFGEGKVTTHLISGLGETEKEFVFAVQECVDIGVLPALFAFTPVEGTALATHPRPNLGSYRRVQLARFLIVNGLSQAESMRFGSDGSIVDFGVSEPLLLKVVNDGKPFLTSGCPSCNRPFYNEKPSGPLYNFPRGVRPEELRAIKRDLKL